MNWTWDIYAICAIAGGLFFIVQLLLGGGGHDADHGDGEHSESKIFSIRSLLVAATFFGIGGKLAAACGAGATTTLVIAIAGGVFAAYLTYLLVNFILKQQASSLLRERDFIGIGGIVHIGIEENGIGEVVVELNGQRKYLPAKSANGQEVKVKTPVKIVESLSGYLIVEPTNV
ncbi:MAG: hypothetical protein LBP56_02865 [Odoribacteraceae bacterium]|jgi:membrane protein implicated in regulation of membrane protease activity|nr:hypothetical protein [Odoribacteraceae bacterium]